MSEYKLGVIESRFADIIWSNEPLASSELAKLALSDENTRRFAEIEAMASDIYALSQNKIGKGQSDYKTMIKLEKADEDENI